MRDDQVIDLESGDGQAFRCRIIDILPLDGNEYALLVNLENSDPVVMQVITNGEQSTFRVIESQKQFERVADYFNRAMLGVD